MEEKDLKKLIMMKMPGKLRFSKEGKWYHDDVFVSHPRIATYFSKHLIFSKEYESWVVEVDGKCVPVEVEDTAQIATSLNIIEDKKIIALLTNSKEVIIDCSNIEVSENNIWYFTDKIHGRIKMLRSVSIQLSPYLHEIKSEFFLKIIDKQFKIKKSQ